MNKLTNLKEILLLNAFGEQNEKIDFFTNPGHDRYILARYVNLHNGDVLHGCRVLKITKKGVWITIHILGLGLDVKHFISNKHIACIRFDK